MVEIESNQFNDFNKLPNLSPKELTEILKRVSVMLSQEKNQLIIGNMHVF